MPAAALQWYINGEKADPVHIHSYKTLTKNGLFTSRLGLSFKVRMYYDMELKIQNVNDESSID